MARCYLTADFEHIVVLQDEIILKQPCKAALIEARDIKQTSEVHDVKPRGNEQGLSALKHEAGATLKVMRAMDWGRALAYRPT